MIYPSADKIEEHIDSRYALVILASKRAKQIKEGGNPLIPTDSVNPLTIALEEIAAGVVQYDFDATSLAGREALADEKAVVGARNLDVDIDVLALPDETELLRAAREALGGGDEDVFPDDDDGDSGLIDDEPEEEEPIALTDDELEATEI